MPLHVCYHSGTDVCGTKSRYDTKESVEDAESDYAKQVIRRKPAGSFFLSQSLLKVSLNLY